MSLQLQTLFKSRFLCTLNTIFHAGSMAGPSHQHKNHERQTIHVLSSCQKVSPRDCSKVSSEQQKAVHWPGRPQQCLAKKGSKPGWTAVEDATALLRHWRLRTRRRCRTLCSWPSGPSDPDTTPHASLRHNLCRASSVPDASARPAAPGSFLCADANANAATLGAIEDAAVAAAGGRVGSYCGRGHSCCPPAATGAEGAAAAAIPNTVSPDSALEGGRILGRCSSHCSPLFKHFAQLGFKLPRL